MSIDNHSPAPRLNRLAPHAATLPRGSAIQGKRAEGQRLPHPATVAQPKRAPHPATVAQPKRAPHPATVAQPSLFDDDDGSLNAVLDAESEEEEEPDYDQFWTLLETLSVKKPSIANIRLEIPLIITKKAGEVDVSGREENSTSPPSFLLEKSSKTKNKKRVYWLPWVANTAMKASRADFEATVSGCDYFFTTELDGCTFTITDDSVMHIAYDYSGGVVKAEKDRTVIAHHTPSDYQKGDTKRRGFAFGVRTKGGWVYYFGSGLQGKNCDALKQVDV